jgi:2-oxoglutarate dehydrogenase E1 component
VDPRSILGGGDVKYHMGATGDFHAANGRVRSECIWSRIRAIWKRSTRCHGPHARQAEAPAAKGAPEGVPSPCTAMRRLRAREFWAETLNMSGVEGFTVGGSVHIIVNNLIGLRPLPRDGILRAFLRTWRSVCRFPFST